MVRISVLLLCAALGAAQDNPFNKPPADVDAALRARIKEFYDLLAQGQARKADALVAEDTKDYFFDSNKPKYLSYEISRIDYFDNFTRAKAVIMAEMYIMMPGFNDKPMKMPTPSAWKIENGKWMWYVDQQALRDTPFGHMTPGPARPGQPPATPPPVANLANMNMSADFLFKQVKANKDEVTLAAGESAEVLVVNSAPGIMDVIVQGAPQGIEAKLEKTSLQSNETAALRIKAGPEARPGAVNIRVEQTGQLIPIQVKLK